MDKRKFVILFLFFLALFSYSFISRSIIDITNHWTSKTCPVHKEKLMKGKVECVVGGWAGIQPANSNSYQNPPFSEGQYPNAKFKYYCSPGCVKTHDKAVILYCKICEVSRVNKSQWR